MKELKAALQFYADTFTWARVAADAKAGVVDFYNYGELARAALGEEYKKSELEGCLQNIGDVTRSQKIKRVISRAKATGTRIGRPPLKIDTAPVLRLQKAGKSIREIAAELHMSPSKVYRTIHRK